LEVGFPLQRQYYAQNFYPNPKREYPVTGEQPKRTLGVMRDGRKTLGLKDGLGGFGSVPEMTGEEKLPADLFFSMRWYKDASNKAAVDKVAQKLQPAKGFRWAQVLELPDLAKGEARCALISVFDDKAAYEASGLAGMDKPDMGEGLYEGVLSVENPRNMADCPEGWKCPF